MLFFHLFLPKNPAFHQLYYFIPILHEIGSFFGSGKSFLLQKNMNFSSVGQGSHYIAACQTPSPPHLFDIIEMIWINRATPCELGRKISVSLCLHGFSHWASICHWQKIRFILQFWVSIGHQNHTKSFYESVMARGPWKFCCVLALFNILWLIHGRYHLLFCGKTFFSLKY